MTVSRELRRNAATRSGGLDCWTERIVAQWHAAWAGRRPKLATLAVNAALQAYVQGRGALRHALTACLRTGRASACHGRGRGKSFIIPEIMIT